MLELYLIRFENVLCLNFFYLKRIFKFINFYTSFINEKNWEARSKRTFYNFDIFESEFCKKLSRFVNIIIQDLQKLQHDNSLIAFVIMDIFFVIKETE
jgi:hypothetical protein